MNDKILQTMEFPVILGQLGEYTATELGRDKALALRPQTDGEKVQQWLNETEDGMNIMRLRGGIPIPKIIRLTTELKRARIGADLNGLEISQIGRVLRTTSELVRFFQQLSDDDISYPAIQRYAEALCPIPDLSGEIHRCVTEGGDVTDEASSLLRQIRFQIRQNEQLIRQQLDEIVRGKQAKYLSDAVITMRNDRYVIPVKQEYRHIFGGVVHDQSASGQTLFMEPKKVVDLNNRLRQAQVAEQQEIARILSELTAQIAPHIDDIEMNLTLIADLDLINAKAKLAKQMKAIVPKISLERQLYFRQARHPLIDEDKVVANDLCIGEDFHTLVITGPNTGGKTLILKTLGLLSLMGQAGLAIPAGEESQIVIYDHIMADIGDEQSIEQNLSTFSGHMKNIVSILQHANEHSLILFDELGAGTDPQEGAALAIAILDYIAAIGSDIVATTHYPELKMYGYNRPLTMNASMEFDVDTLSPTYHLLLGIPGRSNAFEIATRLGLPKTVIQSARQLMKQEDNELNEMIHELEKTRQQSLTEYDKAQQYVSESEQLYHDLKKAYQQWEQQKDHLMKEAKHKANQLVDEASQKAEKVIHDLREREAQLESETLKEHEIIEARSNLKSLYHQEEQKLKKNKVLQKAKRQKEFHVGDEVLVETYGQRGVLLKKEGHEWDVQIGILKMRIDESELQPVAPEKAQQTVMTNVSRTSSRGIPTTLDIRGKRYEEAMVEVERYLDQAILAGYPNVTIIHGKGTGALRKGIQNKLKNHHSVKSFQYAPANSGGDGATIVYFK